MHLPSCSKSSVKLEHMQLKELEKKQEEAEETLAAKDGQIKQLTQQLQREKERYKQEWRMNCEQLIEHDTVLASKDQEIAELLQSLRNVHNSRISGGGIGDGSGAGRGDGSSDGSSVGSGDGCSSGGPGVDSRSAGVVRGLPCSGVTARFAEESPCWGAPTRLCDRSPSATNVKHSALYTCEWCPGACTSNSGTG